MAMRVTFFLVFAPSHCHVFFQHFLHFSLDIAAYHRRIPPIYEPFSSGSRKNDKNHEGKRTDQKDVDRERESNKEVDAQPKFYEYEYRDYNRPENPAGNIN